MKRSLSLFLVLLLLWSLTGCKTAAAPAESGELVAFTDSCGRQVSIPAEIFRVAPSGAVATMLLAALSPEKLVCVSSTPSSSQYKYLPQNLLTLPTTGQLYGSKSTINLESLMAAAPQLIIDLGDPKEGIAADMDALQRQTGIPTVYIEADLDSMAQAYRTLGQLLGVPDRGAALADYIDQTVSMAAENSARLAAEDRVSVMYGSGTSGLNTNALGSIQAQVLDLVGADNAIVVDDVSNKGGGNTINMEQLYLFQPDYILLTPDGPFDTLAQDPAWSQLEAVQAGQYYEIPVTPYNWLSNPPSLNMVLGIRWLGNLLYPTLYDFDMAREAQTFFQLFWGYTLTDEEAAELLANSTLRRDAQPEAAP